MQKHKIAFGPMVGLPSTDWVGRDVAEFLSKEHKISYFKKFDEAVEADTVIILKIMPSMSWIIDQKSLGKKLIYIPIDYFYNPLILERDGIKLSCFDSIMVHNLRLGRLIKKFNDQIFEIDHYLKYKVSPIPNYKEDGFILWVGHLEYLPPLFETLKNVTLKNPLRLLVDLENILEKEEFLRNEVLKICNQFNLIKQSDDEYSLNGLILEQWSKDKQNEYLSKCMAAFDTKGNTFAHNLKPPTKAQKYVYNRIPFAIDKHSYAFEYFKAKGLILPSVDEQDRWHSKEYYNELNDFVEKNEASQSLVSVANSYLHIIDKTTLKELPNGKFIPKIIFSVNSIIYILKKILEKLIS